ncbi:MAG TPA: hypothetical protein VNV85_16200 [Puia sp.]|jgi:hypothetical protein|nr:hypothetical protein [Puia sp.]
MSSIKQEWLQSHAYEKNERLAYLLGITHEELELTDWEMDENNRDHTLVVKFNPGNSSPEILKKITGLDINYTVLLEPNALEYYQEPDEEELGGEG